jgi:hydrogenase maturation protease
LSETLLLSIGSELRGDDGVGKAVLDRISSCTGLPDGVRTVECGLADPSAELFEPGLERAIVIDAADLGLKPGGWRRFSQTDLDSGSLEAKAALEAHGLGLAGALALGRELGTLPRQVVVYGVQPACLDYRMGLSKPVGEAVAEVCQAIRNELKLECG